MDPIRTASKGRYPNAGILSCGQCRRTILCALSDLLVFSRQGWPNCCGEVMALYTAAEKPATLGKSVNDTRFD